MDVRSEGAGRSFRFVKSAMTLLIVGAATCGMASAEEKRTGGPTPSAPGAEVYFSDLKDGATIRPRRPSVSVCARWEWHPPARIARTRAITTC